MQHIITHFRLTTGRDLFQNPIRTLAMIIIVGSAAAMVVALFGINNSITKSTASLNDSIRGSADIKISGASDAGILESYLPNIRGLAEVKRAYPMIQSITELHGKRIIVIGTDQIGSTVNATAHDVISTTIKRSQMSPAEQATKITVGAKLGLTVGDALTLGGFRVRVGAVVDRDASEKINHGYFIAGFLPTVQKLVGKEGRVDTIFVDVQPGSDIATVVSRIDSALKSSGFATQDRASASSPITGLTQSTSLLIAFVAFIVAALVIFNMMTLSAAAKRRRVSLILTIGASKRVVSRYSFAEAIFYGFAGAVMGIPMGAAAGYLSITSLPPVLSAQIDANIKYYFPVNGALLAAGLSIGCCALSGIFASRSVRRQVAVYTAREQAEVIANKQRNKSITLLAGIAGVLGFGVAVALVFQKSANWQIGGLTLVIPSALTLAYSLRVLVVRSAAGVSKRISPLDELSAINLRRAPTRSWTVIMTVALAVALGVSSSGVLENIVRAVDSNLSPISKTDVLVSSSSAIAVPTKVLPVGLRMNLRKIDGVTRIIGSTWTKIKMHGELVSIQGAEPGANTPLLVGVSALNKHLVNEGKGTVISRALAATLGVGAGGEAVFTTNVGKQKIRILQVVNVMTFDAGMAVISKPRFTEWFSISGDSSLEISGAAGLSRTKLRDRVRSIVASLEDSIQVYTGDEGIKDAKAAVGQMGALANAMQWIIAVLSAAALINSFFLTVISRTREIGLVRIVGASNRRMSGAIWAEVCGVVTIGITIGTALGLALHELSLRVVSTFAKTPIPFQFEMKAIIAAAVIAVLCTTGGLVPAIRTSTMNPLEAITDS